ncbi:MAG: lysophospholipid acyltransferase family protein, partial [Opitutales bacterium]|nr:lysophospholipid acyltransferase family protein [Opitutales bacterium]
FNAANARLVSYADGRNFFLKALDAMGAKYEIDAEELKKIPKEGPLIVVANHPTGGLDGVVLGAILCSVRDDAKLLANNLLSFFVGMRPYLISVNPFGGGDAARQNIGAIRDSLKHLKNGGCLATFPSGTVSHLHLKHLTITDPEWNKNIASIARKTGATIVPIFFEGKNSLIFQLAGLISPKLRTALLIREMMRHSRKTLVKARIGSPITPRQISSFETDGELTAWMRLNTYALSHKISKNAPAKPAPVFEQPAQNIKKLVRKILPNVGQYQELILPVSSEKMQEEIDALPQSSVLVAGDRIGVYAAYSWQMKWTMLEIGRLREKTFREVGEGTGKSVDTDEYDQYYMHIFLWDKQNKKIAGAYRVGHVDKIVKSMGVQGLYASTLFNMQPEIFEKMGSALEMGRSFIASEYQKKSSTLAILWKGIGVYISRNPQYRALYGPVSITTEYNAISKDLMVQFLSETKTSQEFSKFVKPKTPPKIKLSGVEKETISRVGGDVEKISALISEIEVDNKGIPVLLKHYLRLNGELLAFNVDKSFGNCIDGLIMVDLTKTDPKLLKSYMGLKEAIEYRKYYGLESPQLEEELNK